MLSSGRIRRFIPTRVGNTANLLTPHHALAVHPHSRGEHRVGGNRKKIKHGSSPLAWGTQTRQGRRAAIARFIPTRVGNTSCRRAIGPTPAVHPHSRGEHLLDGGDQILERGSSPLAWGTRVDQGDHSSTLPVHPHSRGRSSNQEPPVHPHSRGEHHVASSPSGP